MRWEDGRIVEVGAGRAERHYDDAVILPGLRQRALAPRVRGLRRLRRRHAVRALARDAHRAQAHGSSPTTWSRSPAAAPPSRSRPGSRRPPTTASPARPRSQPPSSGCARSSTSRSSRADPDRRTRASSRRSARRRGDRARHDRRLAARARTPARSRLPLVPLARHPRRHAPRGERGENEWLEHGTGAARRGSPILVPPTGKRAVATLEPVLGPELLCAHCVEVDDDEIALLGRARRPGRPLPALERAARLRHRAARRAARGRGRSSASAPTRPPRRRRSTSSRSCAPPSSPRGPASGAPSAARGRRAPPRDDRRGPRAATRRPRWVP